MFGRGYAYASGGTKFNPEFVSPFAQAYYNALKIADGVSDIDTVGLYGTTLDAWKSALDTMCLDLSAADIMDKIIVGKLRRGATRAANAVNLVSPGTYDSTFFNSPTVDPSGGIVYDGLTQYEDSNMTQNTFPSYSDLGCYFKMHDNALASNMGIIGVNSGGTFTLVYNVATFFLNYWGAPAAIDQHAYSNDSFAYVKNGTTVKTFVNGSVVETATQGGSLTLGSRTLKSAAYDADGSIVSFADVTLRNEFYFHGLSDYQVTQLHTIIAAFDAATGR